MIELRNYNIKRVKLLTQSLKKMFIIFIVSILSIGSVLAQGKGIIAGVISDKQGGETLIGANVMVEGTSFGASTNIDGEYIMTNIPAGKYVLKISYIGYKNHSVEIEVIADEKLALNIGLDYSGIELDAVEITAQARGQLSAINNQLNADDIRNVVSAERIQELPDANVAETIGRMSGVSVLRSGGEGNKVVIRGMSPKYNKITIEGVSMAGGATDRSTDISMISPYSLDGIEVRKTATADNDADFIGGSVNFKLRTADPDWRTNIVAQVGYNQLKKTASDYMITGSISNRFFDDKLGVYLQGNTERRNRSSNTLNASYSTRNSAVVGKTNPVYIQNLNLSDDLRTRSRNGITAVVDYKIQDGEITFMNFYNKSISKIDRYSQIFKTTNRRHEYQPSKEQYDLSTYSNILGFEKRLNRWKIEAKVSHSYTNNENPNKMVYLFGQEAALSSEVTTEPISPEEVINFTTISDNDTYLQKLNKSTMYTKERQIGAFVNVHYDFRIFDNLSGIIKAGGKYRYKDQAHDRTVYGSNLSIGSGQSGTDAIVNAFGWQESVGVGNDIAYPMLYDTEFDHGNFLEGKYNLGPVANLGQMQEVWNVLETTEGLSIDAYYPFERSSTTSDYSGSENYYAGYILTEFNIGKKLKFNPGVRYEKNTTVYTANQGITNPAFFERQYTYESVTTTRENSYFLPMINMKYDPLEWFSIRAAYTHTLSRPSYAQFTPKYDIGILAVSWNNYKLEPEFSKNIDLYFSFHQDALGLFTVGGFMKKIDNMIFNLGRRTIVNPEDYDLPEDTKYRDIYTTANNEYQATVKGIELDWQTTFWYLPGALKGLVLNVNYTHIVSEAKYPYTQVINTASGPFDPPVWENIDSFYVSQLINQPDDIVNVQLGYDYKGFSARVSMLYQSSIFKNPRFFPEESYYADDYMRWDLSVKQKLPWFGMQAFCNLNNLTGAKDVYLVKGGNWDANIQHYGMTIDLGLRVKF